MLGRVWVSTFLASDFIASQDTIQLVRVLGIVKDVNLTCDLTLVSRYTAQELSVVVRLGVYERHTIDGVLFLELGDRLALLHLIAG